MWTYSGNPGVSAKDAVRFLIGDTDQKHPLLQDGEITYLLSQYNNSPLNAAIRACEGVMAKFSRMADESVGSVKINFSQKAKGYSDLIGQLRQRLSLEDVRPYAGGISLGDKNATASNNDRTRPEFSKHMFENEQISPWLSFVKPDLNEPEEG